MVIKISKEEIGKIAKMLDEKSIYERIKVKSSFFYKLTAVIIISIIAVLVLYLILGIKGTLLISWEIVFLGFLFETMDSSSGMGFGTGLTPLLFLMGYSPLQVVPVLLISETITGLLDAIFDHELHNVQFSFKPLNEATKISLNLGFLGSLSIIISIIIGYLAIELPSEIIKLYVAVLVIFMGVSNIFRVIFYKKIKNKKYNPKKLIGFAVLAGFNKGIGGGGYGPVITLGEIMSGIYEKSATAISSFAECIVSFVGVLCFFFISNYGVAVDYAILPSILIGGIFAAVLSPYLVRILPNKIWKFVIPLYAFALGIYSLISLII